MNEYKNIAIKGFEEAVDSLNRRLSKIQTGRANPMILDGVHVEYYGSMTPLNQLATVSVQEGRSLVIKPFDCNSLKNIEKGINEANLGFNPINDGENIRINIPPLTEDRRKELSREAKAMGEDAKINIRNERAAVLKDIKNDESFSEDEQKRAEDIIQEEVDKYNQKVEEIIKAKEAELMTV